MSFITFLCRISQKFGEIWSYLYFCSDHFKKYMMKRLLFSALAFVCMAGRAQTQEPLDSVDRLFELKEVVIRGDLPNTRVKGNAMITRIQGTPLSDAGTLGEMLVKVPGMKLKCSIRRDGACCIDLSPFVTEWYKISQMFGNIRNYLYLCIVKR